MESVFLLWICIFLFYFNYFTTVYSSIMADFLAGVKNVDETEDAYAEREIDRLTQEYKEHDERVELARLASVERAPERVSAVQRRHHELMQRGTDERLLAYRDDCVSKRKPLVARRAVMRSAITRCTNKLDELVRDNDPNTTEWTAIQYGTAESIRIFLEDRTREYDTVERDITDTYPEELYSSDAGLLEVATVVQGNDDYMFRFSEVMLSLQGFKDEYAATILGRSTPRTPSHAGSFLPGGSPFTLSTPVAPTRTAAAPFKVKLPTVTVPTFDGSYTNWPSFVDLWTSVIDRNSEVDKAMKLFYLKSAVKGDALKMISPLTTSEANYTIAWAMLVKRYENKRLIRAKHFDNILNFPPAKSESVAYLRKTSETFQLNLSALANQGQTIGDFVLTHILNSKLDAETRKVWEIFQTSRPSTASPPTYADLVDFIEVRARALEAANVSTHRDSTNDQKKGRQDQKRTTPQQTYVSTEEDGTTPSQDQAALFSQHPPAGRGGNRGGGGGRGGRGRGRGQGGRGGGNPPANPAAAAGACAHCDKPGHKIFSCNEFKGLEVAARRTIVREKGLCYRCLMHGHPVKKCGTNLKCKEPGCTQVELHNTLVHPVAAPP